jgi:sugar (pentulose or hexulose) kinase
VLQYAEVLDMFATTPEQIKVIGPAVRNDLWMQLKADLLGVPLSASRADEVVSRGAQALASGASLDWAAHDPVEVVPDVSRHDELRSWVEHVLPLWRHLQESPS